MSAFSLFAGEVSKAGRTISRTVQKGTKTAQATAKGGVSFVSSIAKEVNESKEVENAKATIRAADRTIKEQTTEAVAAVFKTAPVIGKAALNAGAGLQKAAIGAGEGAQKTLAGAGEGAARAFEGAGRAVGGVVGDIGGAIPKIPPLVPTPVLLAVAAAVILLMTR